MATFSSIKPLQSFDWRTLWNRLLRKQNINRFIRGSRYTLLAIAIWAPLFAAYFILDSVLVSRNSALALENKVQSILDGVKDSLNSEGPEDVTGSIAQRNMFGSLGVAPVATPAATPIPQTSLSLTLIGTFITHQQEPYAIIEDKKKQVQDVFVLNQSVFAQATLKKIYEDRVEVDHNGKIEILKLDDLGGGDKSDATGIAAEGDEFVVAESEIDKGLENLPLLLTQARAVPYFKDGRAIGLRLFAIKNASLYERLGLKNGDILKSINGNSLGDLSQALKLFEQLKQERSIALTLERDRQDREFKYTIK